MDTVERIEERFRTPIRQLWGWDWERVLYLILILLALCTRLAGLGDRVQSHDESLHTRYSWDLYRGFGFQHTPLMHGPSLFHMAALSYFLFTDNDFSARLPVALIGVVVVAFPYWLRRWLGRAGALMTSFFLLISPSIAYYSRYIRHDIPLIFFSLLTLLAIFRYLECGSRRWLYLLAVSVALMFTTMEAAFIYNATFGVFLVGLFILRVLRGAAESLGSKPIIPAPASRFPVWASAVLIAAAVAFVSLLPVVQAASICYRLPEMSGSRVQCVSQVLPGETIPSRVRWVLLGFPLLSAVALFGIWRLMVHYHGERSFDLVVVLGTLCLPFLSPLLVQLAQVDPMDYSAPAVYYSGAILVEALLLTVAIGGMWDLCGRIRGLARSYWLECAVIFATIVIVLFTTVFTNGRGVMSGLIGSLGYWLAQHGVRRGNQPWYYYLAVTVPQYEFLPLVLSVAGSIYVGVRTALRKTGVPLFVLFLIWWMFCAWLAYSIAGEKMPWLTVHIALPMLLFAGWTVGEIVRTIDWSIFRSRRVWLLFMFVPLFVTALAAVVTAMLAGPFQSTELGDLNVTGRLLSGLLGTVGFGLGIGYVVYRGGWRIALCTLALILVIALTGLTVHTMWRFCFINYDYPNEMLVYAHAGPDVKETMRQIEQLSRRIAGGPEQIQVAYGADGSWPFHWYLRNYPNAIFYGTSPSREAMSAPVIIAGREEWSKVEPFLGDQYIFNTYTYLWWPAEDYRDLTWSRIVQAIANPQMRLALWKVWLNRDYSLYDELTGKKHTFDQWPLRNEYRLYIRRDLAAQVWDVRSAGGANSSAQ